MNARCGNVWTLYQGNLSTGQRRPKHQKKTKKPKPAKKAKPAKKDKLIVKMQFKKRPKGAPVEVKALPVKEGPIKHAEDYQLQEPS